MASEPLELSEPQRAILRAVCDTFVPAVEKAEDHRDFFARKASDLGVDSAWKHLQAHQGCLDWRRGSAFPHAAVGILLVTLAYRWRYGGLDWE
jgi:hypothetical protein